MRPISESTVLVTGATDGLGRALAGRLHADGAQLLLHGRDPAKLDAVAAQLPGAQTMRADFASLDEVRRLAAEVDRVDVLVNNAGISFIAPAEDTAPEDWRRVLEVNLTGPFLLCQAFGRLMLEAGVGSIVNVASIAGLRGVADRAAYNASKHGLVGLTRTLAAEWGGRGVRVNAVCPGWVKTEMDVADQAAGGYVDTDIVEQVPMGRFAAPDDIAETIAFLADPLASGFVNGVTLPIDGGWTADASWTSLRLRKR
jgi:NAD(P)-dependent dehydrogenase (short-subunit alcohol dehydrogenase family)